MSFLPWPEIESFNNIRKFIKADPTGWFRNMESLTRTSTVTYKSKVKLHGMNHAVQVHFDGTIVAQSRTTELSLTNDNAGFARWVESNKDVWRDTIYNSLYTEKNGYIFYGEWVGKGIQKGVSVSDIPNKSFAIFAARPLGDNDYLFIEPDVLTMLLNDGVPDTYVLPWFDQSIDIDWSLSDEELTKVIAPINDWVSAIDSNDPWVESTFGIKGAGEGLVFYPTSDYHLGWEIFKNLVFKAKGESHKNIKTAVPVQVNAEAAASVDSFVELVLTNARLNQGATTVGGFDMKLTGKFVAWCLADLQKECQDELSASNLDWKAVQKPLSDKARSWYLAEAKVK